MYTDNTTPQPNGIVPRRIADLSPDEKPREKAMAKGIRILTDAELLAILIGGGVPGKSAIELAREILGSCNNSINRLAQISIRSMARKFEGIGPAKAVTIAAAIELGSRRTATEEDAKHVRGSADAYRILAPHLVNLPHEEFWAIFLRRNNTVISVEQIAAGGTAATYVDAKLLFKKALDNLAESIIVGHNHPSGNITPSTNDDNLTRKIKDAAKLLDIPLLDHIVVTATAFYSYADNSRL